MALTALFVELPRINPDLVRATNDFSKGSDTYIVIDKRPDVGDYYIDLYCEDKSRSIQKHKTKKQLENHRKDFRFPNCCLCVASDNSVFDLPSVNEWLTANYR